MRRTLGAAIAAAAAILAAPALAEWPQDDEITFVIPYSPGGGFDTYVRALAPVLEKQLGEGAKVVPENMPGAGGNKGSAHIARSEPDGYTIGILNIPGLNVAKIRGDQLTFDPDQFTWLANLGTDTYGIGVAANSEIKTVEDLCNLGRPAKLAQTGPSSTGYITTNIAFQLMDCPIDIVTGYEGSSEIIVAVMRGEVDATIRPVGSMEDYVKSGDLRIIMTLEDEPSVEGVPSSTQAGHEELKNLTLERMIVGPPGMPEDLTQKLSEAIVAAASSPELQEWAESTSHPLDPTGAQETKERYQQLSEFYTRYKEYLGEAQ